MTTEVRRQERKLGLPQRMTQMGTLPAESCVFTSHSAQLPLSGPCQPPGSQGHGSAFSAGDGQPALTLFANISDPCVHSTCANSGQAAILPGLDHWSLCSRICLFPMSTLSSAAE